MTKGTEQIAEVLRQVLDRKIHPIEACRALVRMRDLFPDPNDDDFLALVGIESETDDLPLGDVRTLWAPSALAGKDAELREYLQRVEHTLTDACSSLLAKSRHW